MTQETKHPLDSMTPEEIRVFTMDLLKKIDEFLPPKTGFMILFTPFSSNGGKGHFGTNIVLQDAVNMAIEWVESKLYPEGESK